MTKEELTNRFEFLNSQIDGKKLEVEKALLALEKICKELIDIEEKLKKLNEVENSSI